MTSGRMTSGRMSRRVFAHPPFCKRKSNAFQPPRYGQVLPRMSVLAAPARTAEAPRASEGQACPSHGLRGAAERPQPMTAPVGPVHIWASHIPSSPAAPAHDFRIGERAPHPENAQASEGGWRLLLADGAVLVEATIDPVTDAAEALRSRGVHLDSYVTIFSPSANPAHVGPLRTM
jgi:hypothetical protein